METKERTDLRGTTPIEEYEYVLDRLTPLTQDCVNA